MKKIIMAALAVALLSGCATREHVMSQKDISSADMNTVIKCSVYAELPENVQNCTSEVNKRIQAGEISLADANEVALIYKEGKINADKVKAYKEYYDHQIAEQNINSLTNTAVAAYTCNQNPVLCHVHEVNTNLNDAGW